MIGPERRREGQEEIGEVRKGAARHGGNGVGKGRKGQAGERQGVVKRMGAFASPPCLETVG